MFLCNPDFHFFCCNVRSQRVTDNVTTSVVEKIWNTCTKPAVCSHNNRVQYEKQGEGVENVWKHACVLGTDMTFYKSARSTLWVLCPSRLPVLHLHHVYCLLATNVSNFRSFTYYLGKYSTQLLIVKHVFQISSFGVVCNSYLLVRFVYKKNLNAFQTICLLKSLCNLIICLSFLFWVSPTLFLSLTFAEVNYVLNRLNGLIAGTAAFFLSECQVISSPNRFFSGSLLNILNSSNRVFALQCPFGFKKLNRIPVTSLSIGIRFIYLFHRRV